MSADKSPFTLLPWERIVWTARPWPSHRGRTYLLTDLRLLVADPHAEESIDVPLDEIRGLTVRPQGVVDRVLRRMSVVITRHPGAPAEVPLDHLSHRQVQSLVQQLVGRQAIELAIDPLLVEEAVSSARPIRLRAMAGTAFGVIFLATLIVFVPREEPPIAYPRDDAIYPGGAKRNAEEITLFMEREVMPWARATLGPVVGGADRVTCETCHGQNGKDRGWAMPGVAELPYPKVRAGGLGTAERYAWLSSDPQLRNAVYADLAQDDRQATAGYMRQVVMPGMAKLLRRPTYDFTRSYGENRTRFAFGCYHCHRVR
jgi:hypothetical protein